jgi:hypothetical protein
MITLTRHGKLTRVARMRTVEHRRTGLVHQDAQDDFDHARRATWAKLAGWLHGHPSSRNRLAVLGEVTPLTGARRLEYEPVGHLGSTAEMLVPIDQIVGTVEPTWFFDRRFRPTSDVPRTRFERIAADILSGRGMDPVDLYRRGGIDAVDVPDDIEPPEVAE